jgi:hypothetical protein
VEELKERHVLRATRLRSVRQAFDAAEHFHPTWQPLGTVADRIRGCWPRPPPLVEGRVTLQEGDAVPVLDVTRSLAALTRTGTVWSCGSLHCARNSCRRCKAPRRRLGSSVSKRASSSS